MDDASAADLPPRTWGFRCSSADVLVLAGALPSTWLCLSWIGSMAWIIPVAVGHFFLFCNVFRIRRRKEILWAVACLVNVAAWTAADRLRWPVVLAVQAPLTVVLVIAEMRAPTYHGVWARRLNPQLDDWLERRI